MTTGKIKCGLVGQTSGSIVHEVMVGDVFELRLPMHPRLVVPAPVPPGWDALAPLVSLRLWLAVSQAEVAHAWPGGGCTRAYVSALERGRSGLRVTPEAAALYRSALYVAAVAFDAYDVTALDEAWRDAIHVRAGLP
jgi:hypothetical protein